MTIHDETRKSIPGKVVIYGLYPSYPPGEQLLMSIPGGRYHDRGEHYRNELTEQGFTITAITDGTTE